MTGVMTQWMKDRLARQHEEARQEGLEEGHKEGYEEGYREGRLEGWLEARMQKGWMEVRRDLNAWARQQELAPPFPDMEDGPTEDR